MKEKDIVFELRDVWVLKEKDAYTVMLNTGTHSTSDSSYYLNDDGLSIAIVRAKYLQNKYELNRS